MTKKQRKHSRYVNENKTYKKKSPENHRHKRYHQNKFLSLPDSISASPTPQPNDPVKIDL